MAGRACKAALCCAKLAAACDRIGWDELAAQVRQIDKQLLVQIEQEGIPAVKPPFSDEQIEQIIECGEAGYERAIRAERLGAKEQAEIGDELVGIVT